MMDKVEIESKHAPPLAECAHCEHMLPPGLGEIICEVCGAGCRVSHGPTVEALIEEKVPCPHCHTILVAGTDERPIDLTCGACSGGFALVAKVANVEITSEFRHRNGKREWLPTPVVTEEEAEGCINTVSLYTSPSPRVRG